MDQNTKRKAGRKPKQDPQIYRYAVYLNAEESNKVRIMMSKTGESNRSRFIASMILKRDVRVVHTDKSMLDCYKKLTEFYQQYRAVETNYNQAVKAIHKNFGFERAFFMLRELQAETNKLLEIKQKFFNIIKKMEDKWLQK